MRAIRDGDPDAELVIAAQRGDRAALDALLAQYLPLLYNIVGRALNGHADVDDVVQETMLRVVRSIGDVRDPAAFRSWLVAVAVRKIRDHVSGRPLTLAGDGAPEVADPGADFVDLTIMRLGLSGQRRETAEATRWLDGEDRELLALWWQEAAGAVDRGTVAAGLGMTPAHTAVRIGRMKERLTTARLVVRALQARPRCAELAEVTALWDDAPSPLWRKRIARHMRDCPHCGAHQRGLIPAERLLAGLVLVPPPASAGVARPGPAAHGAHRAPGRAATRLRHGPAAARTAGSLPVKLAAAAVAVGCAAAGGAVIIHLRAAHPVAAASRASHAPAPATASANQALARPSARPVPVRSRRPRPVATHPTVAPAVTGAKKGVGAWAFTGATQALSESGASWYYTWSATPGVAGPPGTAFVPMIWGTADVTASTLSQVKQEGPYLLGFNEPDMASQSNMTPAQALSLWPQLMATGMQLGSPAVADDGATPGGWLDQFMSGATARGYRVNFITLHWYGSDFATGAAVSQLQSYLQAVYARYHLPIWLTEFGMVKFGSPTTYPTDAQQSAFLTGAASMMASLGYVQRYAWFALPVTTGPTGDGNLGLFGSGPAVTPEGRAFEAAAGQ